MLRTLIALVAALFLLCGSANAEADQRPQLFSSAEQAQKHCPSDIVVWLNLPTGVYHFRGQRWYGNTKAGAYVCKTEADAVGDRPTRNGQ